MHVAFACNHPTTVGHNAVLEVLLIRAIPYDSCGRFCLLCHLPEYANRRCGRCHGVRHLVGLVRLIGQWSVLLAYSPAWVAQSSACSGSSGGRRVLVELEVAIGSIYEIRVLCGYLIRLRARTHVCVRVVRNGMCQQRVLSVNTITLVVRIVFGVHEDTIAHLCSVNITKIDTTCILRIVERAVVNSSRFYGSTLF